MLPLLRTLARRAMVARGLEPDFPPAALAEVGAVPAALAPRSQASPRLPADLPWCSIDNDDSRDLDQLTAAIPLAGGASRILVAIADVASLVPAGSALDSHARTNTTSVYTAAVIFPMLPERLSTDLTSLNFDVDRRAVVSDMTFAADGTLAAADVYPAVVRNRAKLAYPSVARWLDGTGPVPPAITAVPGLAENLRLQFAVATRLRALRQERGALTFETTRARPVIVEGQVRDIAAETPDHAKNLIEDFMIATNGVTARFLDAQNFPSIRRVVRTPKNWDRIVALAALHGTSLPVLPDSRALEKFLLAAKAADPDRFPDLSLSVIKLLGAGEYVLELPGATSAGHFGLAVRDYAHSTAPNRRYPDLVTQRLLLAAIAGEPVPYTDEQLASLARHCTVQEDAANKVERQVSKSAAALVLVNRIGETFEGIVTGAGQKGTWVRITRPAVEGRLDGPPTLEVGDRVRVQLTRADVDRGFLDFRAVT